MPVLLANGRPRAAVGVLAAGRRPLAGGQERTWTLPAIQKASSVMAMAP